MKAYEGVKKQLEEAIKKYNKYCGNGRMSWSEALMWAAIILAVLVAIATLGIVNPMA